jgi:FKBP-type peptidyl-prolyl cis-trans isomerase FklB
MKFRIVAVAGLGVAVACFTAVGQDTPKGAPVPAPAQAPEFKDLKSKGSYAFGLRISKDLKPRGIEIDPDLVLKGLKDGMAGGKALLTDEQVDATLREMLQEASDRMAKKNKAEGEKNKTDGEAFLAQNAKKPGVVTLKSGLQYKVVTDGTGPIPKETDEVVCHYKGTLIDGTEFDSSYKRGEPATFPVNGVIPGWIEALQKMKVGSKWQLFIPSNLAYGDKQRGQVITPNSTLLFDIELIKIK